MASASFSSTCVIQQQQQLILRISDEELCEEVRWAVSSATTTGSSYLYSRQQGQNNNYNATTEGPTTIDILPDESTIGDFIFQLNDRRYPAMLVNLPTLIETHKTADQKTFAKSGEIGQMLQVFSSVAEKEATRGKLTKLNSHTSNDYSPSGLTPPATNIVSRRFDKTNKVSSIQYFPYHVREVINEICSPWEVDPSDDKEFKEWKYEEVVPFEDWMVDPENPTQGISMQLSGQNWTTRNGLVMEHPEVLLLRVELEDDADKEEHFERQRSVQQLSSPLSQAAMPPTAAAPSQHGVSSSVSPAASAPVTGSRDRSESMVSSTGPAFEEDEEEEEDLAWMQEI